MPIRTVIVGASHRAKVYGLDLIRLGDLFELVGIADIDADRALEMAQILDLDNGCVYTDDEAMFSDLQPELVIIGTPPSAHCENIEKALTFKPKRILSIPPFAMTAAQAGGLYKLIEQDGRTKFSEAHPFFFSQWWANLERELRLPLSGVCSGYMSSFSRQTEDELPSDEVNTYHSVPKVGGVQWKFLPALITCANRLTGDLPLAVHARGERGKRDTFVRMSGTIEYVHGHIFHFDVAKMFGMDHLILNSPDAHFNIVHPDWLIFRDVPTLILQGKHDRQVQTSYGMPTDVRLQLLRSLGECFEEDCMRIPSLCESCVSMYCLDAIIASALDLREVEVEIPESICDAYEKQMNVLRRSTP
ncbi:MAG: gfo/Idh/MocA family oxidoreductase [Lentisphaerae bacterium]|nr:MAG: gfo/Idh/MocA family oxidoreductase [Lentisphaerota bacterium]